MSNRSSFEQAQDGNTLGKADFPSEDLLSLSVTDATTIQEQAKETTENIRDKDDFEDEFTSNLEGFNDENATENTQEEQHQSDDKDFDDFGDFDDEFVDAGDNDDFGDFDDFEPTEEQIEPIAEEPKTPTEAEIYVDVLENRPDEIRHFIDDYLGRIWGEATNSKSMENQEQQPQNQFVSSPIEQGEDTTDILNTPCSRDLWSKLSRDTVFYNPVTGSVGQFQWTRSETNKAYLNALGVTFNVEEKSPTSIHSSAGNSSASHANNKKRQTALVDGKRLTTPASSESLPSSPDASSQTHARSASATGGLRVVTTKMDEGAKEAKKEAEQEMELDIDIARAYCELTEETIRVFPDVKLNAMVIELSRLQRQAADYLETLLDQREQLKMDAETYNDLISCIVGHAQRLHVQTKDASPAMVSKKKKANGTFSNLMRRKTTTSNPQQQSVSMGGGVVGVKQQAPTPKRTVSTAAHMPILNDNSRRSM